MKSTKFFLTYSQTDNMPKAHVELALKDLLPHLQTLVVSQEHHKDGNQHYHVLVMLSLSLETTNCRFFDLTWEDKVYHPNIESKIKKDAVLRYITKEDIEPSVFCKLDESTPYGFKRRKDDYDEWLNYRAAKKPRIPILEKITLPDEWVDEHGNHGPTHHFTGRNGGGMVLIGPSGIGKTTMVIGSMKGQTDTIIKGWLTDEMTNTFMVDGSKKEYHMEGYLNQSWIVYDDVTPDPSHLLKILQRYPIEMIRVPGAPRYHHVMMKGNAIRNVIVILNPCRNKIDWKQEGLDSRFRVYNYQMSEAEALGRTLE